MPGKKFLNRRVILLSLPLLIAILIFFSARLAISHPDFVEKYYSRGIYPSIAMVFSLFSNLVPFSLWDLLVIVVVVLVIGGLILVISRKIRPRWYLFQMFQWILLFYSVFYLTWGFNYFRPDIETRLGWKKAKPDDATFMRVVNSLIKNANDNYTVMSASDYEDINLEIEKSFRERSGNIGISYPNGNRRPKTIILSSYFAKSGISGYFGPFFHEVHINYYQLPMDYPFILAHEKAHQFGIANEAEANLAAYIVCAGSDDKRLRYSGNLYLLLYFLKDAQESGDIHYLLEKLDKPVMQDLLHREKYYDELRNKKMEEIHTNVNDLYLKTQNIKIGIKNYSQVVGLAISWYRHSGQS